MLIPLRLQARGIIATTFMSFITPSILQGFCAGRGFWGPPVDLDVSGEFACIKKRLGFVKTKGV
jgi:hypothetical protein